MDPIRLLKPIETKPKAIEEEVSEEEEPLSPSARLFHEPNFNVHILSIMATKSRIDPQAMKEQWIPNFANHPRFCSLMVQSNLYNDNIVCLNIFLECLCPNYPSYLNFDMPIGCYVSRNARKHKI